jgi:hypothetical protein
MATRKPQQSSTPITMNGNAQKSFIIDDHKFTRSFAPLLSKKDGSARLTYAGYKHDCRKDGTNPYIKLIFTCRDVTHKNPANISILSNYKISKIVDDSTKMNKITRSMLAMGYQFPEAQNVIIDEEDEEFGYAIIDDEDGFTASIYDFLKDMKGLVYKGKLDQDEKGFYRIQIESLKPLLDKTGKQLRDYEANEAISADELEIDIDDTELN